HLDRGTRAWRRVTRGLRSRDTRGSMHRSPLGLDRSAVLYGRTRALVSRDTRRSIDPGAHLDPRTSAWRRCKGRDRSIDPDTSIDPSSLGTERHAGIDRSKCTDRSIDLRLALDPERGGELTSHPWPWSEGSTARDRDGRLFSARLCCSPVVGSYDSCRAGDVVELPM